MFVIDMMPKRPVLNMRNSYINGKANVDFDKQIHLNVDTIVSFEENYKLFFGACNNIQLTLSAHVQFYMIQSFLRKCFKLI